MNTSSQHPRNARMLTAIVIPPEILSLRHARLPEKLLLAIYAADPATKRVRRAMSMTRAGLRKLEQRLIGKGLLTVLGGRHMVHVPGLVYTGHEDGGHFVSEKPTTKSREKVADHGSPAARASAAELVIPAPLLNFRYLSASDKMLLAYYAANPTASNVEVVAVLGVSTSGLKKLKSTLLERQVLIASNEGYTIRLPGYVLVRDSQGSHFVAESDAVKSGHKVSHAAPRLTPARDVYTDWKSSVAQITRNGNEDASYLLDVTTKMIKRIEEASPDGQDREDALAVMKQAENALFARDVLNNFLQRCAAKAMQWLARLSEDHVGLARGSTLILSLCSMILMFRVVGRGSVVATATSVIIFVTWPGLQQLSVAAMLELPAMAIMWSSAFLLAKQGVLKWGELLAAATLCAIAISIKLTALLVVPGMMLTLVLRGGPAGKRWKSVAAFLILCVSVFALTNVWLAQPNPFKGFANHIRAAQTLDATVDGHPFVNPVAWLPGAMCACLAIASARQMKHTPVWILCITCLATALAVHSVHRPWWYYYEVHFAYPIAALAGLGAGVLFDTSRTPLRSLSCLGAWVGTIKGYFAALILAVIVGVNIPDVLRSRADITHVDGSVDRLIIGEIRRYGVRDEWMFSGRPSLVHWADRLVPPELTVLVWKREWSGEITTEGIVSTLRRYNVGQLVLNRYDQLAHLEWKDFVEEHFTRVGVYGDLEHYVRSGPGITELQGIRITPLVRELLIRLEVVTEEEHDLGMDQRVADLL